VKVNLGIASKKGIEMRFLQIEMLCPINGFERFRIKVVTRVNIPRNTIIPKFRKRSRSDELRYLVVGRNVDEHQIRRYLLEYFRQRGMLERIISIKFIK